MEFDYLDILEVNGQLFGLENSVFHLLDYQELNQTIWLNFTILFFGP